VHSYTHSHNHSCTYTHTTTSTRTLIHALIQPLLYVHSYTHSYTPSITQADGTTQGAQRRRPYSHLLHCGQRASPGEGAQRHPLLHKLPPPGTLTASCPSPTHPFLHSYTLTLPPTFTTPQTSSGRYTYSVLPLAHPPILTLLHSYTSSGIHYSTNSLRQVHLQQRFGRSNIAMLACIIHNRREIDAVRGGD
jgi:hypothetical protein